MTDQCPMLARCSPYINCIDRDYAKCQFLQNLIADQCKTLIIKGLTKTCKWVTICNANKTTKYNLRCDTNE